MRLAVLDGPHSFEVVAAPVPEIAPDEVLVRTAACGVSLATTSTPVRRARR